MLFFTDAGRVYQVRVWDIPETTRQAKGQAVVNLINIESGEKVTSVLTYSLKKDEQKESGVKFILMATKNGTIKKSKLTDYENIRRSGLVAIKLEKGDELIWAKLTSGEDDILLVSHDGKSIRFKESEVRPTGRDTMGVRGILFKGADSVVSVDVINEETKKADFLTVMEKGIGKKTAIKDFPRQKRGGQGVKVAEIKEKTGKPPAALSSCDLRIKATPSPPPRVLRNNHAHRRQRDSTTNSCRPLPFGQPVKKKRDYANTCRYPSGR
ncbi:MAG: gyrase subunit A protein [Candidatus Gottesmanbacteria bacterium GW2011_GWA2_47_9]|uniref:Gyrase subunit A protein n=1 Tax=Candidatus Gottesmanbacteria bacterium GW2011_GWA2_47_9 TaxID=1618445 RepID=A0A0G1U1Q0_9BACT|nr:MAG: gyrase subunit A protein [Candidatus Gottesmanbacteria bacterium GW2011_GWA2_47_9]